MFRKITILSIILSFFCFQETIASAQNKLKEQLSIELMTKSGLDQQINNRPDYLSADITNNFKRVLLINSIETNKITKELSSMVSKSFRPEIIKSIVIAHIETDLKTEDIKAVLSWLNSPLGKKITRMEEEASTPEAFKEKLALVPLLKKKADYKERIRLIQDLDQYMKVTESDLKNSQLKRNVTVEAMKSAFPTIHLPVGTLLQEDFKTYSTAMRRSIAYEISMSLLYCYRQLDINELEEYINFIKTDYGIKYHNVINEALQKAYLFCGKQFGKNFGEMLAKESSQQFKKPNIQTYPQRK